MKLSYYKLIYINIKYIRFIRMQNEVYPLGLIICINYINNLAYINLINFQYVSMT